VPSLRTSAGPGNRFNITLLDAIGPDSRKLVAAFCLQSWQRITSEYELDVETQEVPGEFLCKWDEEPELAAVVNSTITYVNDDDEDDPFAHFLTLCRS
jgi:hypothetical protein